MNKKTRKDLKGITGYFATDDPLYQYVLTKAKERRLSQADIVREALLQWRERQQQAQGQ